MKKILLPIDFSDNSQQAVKYAVEMFGETVYKKDVEFVDLLEKSTSTT